MGAHALGGVEVFKLYRLIEGDGRSLLVDGYIRNRNGARSIGGGDRCVIGRKRHILNQERLPRLRTAQGKSGIHQGRTGGELIRIGVKVIHGIRRRRLQAIELDVHIRLVVVGPAEHLHNALAGCGIVVLPAEPHILRLVVRRERVVVLDHVFAYVLVLFEHGQKMSPVQAGVLVRP